MTTPIGETLLVAWFKLLFLERGESDHPVDRVPVGRVTWTEILRKMKDLRIDCGNASDSRIRWDEIYQQNELEAFINENGGGEKEIKRRSRPTVDRSWL